MKEFVLLILTGLCTSILVNAQNPDGQVKISDSQANITYTLINAANNSWGYDIYSNNKLTIHQPSKPGIAGNEGFRTKEAATKVAELVVSKMKKGEMPPTVTKEEMEKMKVL